MNWVHLSTRLLVASIFVLVGEAGPRVVNPLIGGLASASSRHSGFIGLHSIGGGTHSLASMADTLAWLADPPVACVLGSVSNVGLLLHLPSRYGLEHCRVRLHRLEASAMAYHRYWKDKPVALSIVQARLVGLAHFSIGYVLTYGPFVIAASLTISRGS